MDRFSSKAPPCKRCSGVGKFAYVGERVPGQRVFRKLIWELCPSCRGSGRKSAFAWDIVNQRPIYS